MSTVALVPLVKGQNVSLTKDNPSLTEIGIGLGWDVNSGNGDKFDLDASAFILKNDKLHNGGASIVFFNNKTQPGITHEGDNLTGDGDGDDETINVVFSALPADVDKIQIVVNIFDAQNRRQNFGMVKNAFVRVYDKTTKNELAKYDLSEDYSANNAVVFGELYKKDNEWKFKAIGEGKNGDTISWLLPWF